MWGPIVVGRNLYGWRIFLHLFLLFVDLIIGEVMTYQVIILHLLLFAIGLNCIYSRSLLFMCGVLMWPRELNSITIPLRVVINNKSDSNNSSWYIPSVAMCVRHCCFMCIIVLTRVAWVWKYCLCFIDKGNEELSLAQGHKS